MTALATISRLAARPAVFFYSLVVLVVGWGLRATVSRGLPNGLGVDQAIIDAFLFPAMFGLLAGQLIHELQHCTFTWTLPAAPRRSLAGFLASGAVLSLFMVALLTGSGHSPTSLFAVAFAAYCLGSLFVDPLGPTAPFFTIPIAFLVLIFSRTVGAGTERYPSLTLAVAALVGGLCAWRMFSRETFRRKPFLPTKSLTTAFHPAASARFRRETLIESGARKRAFNTAYMGTDLGRWTRATAYEVYGGFRLYDLRRLLGPLLPLALVAGLHAKLVAAEGGFIEALLKTLYHSFLRPPDMPSFSEKGEPHFLIVMLVCIAGIAMVAYFPAALTPGRLYPLSRGDLGRLTFRNQVVLSAAFALVTALFYGGLGLLAGHLAGYPPRLDFVPLWLRALLWTLAVMPFGYMYHLRMRGERGTDAILGVILLQLVCTVGVSVVVLFVAALWPALMEMAVVTAVIVGGQAILRRRVRRYFATADLV